MTVRKPVNEQVGDSGGLANKESVPSSPKKSRDNRALTHLCGSERDGMCECSKCVLNGCPKCLQIDYFY